MHNYILYDVRLSPQSNASIPFAHGCVQRISLKNFVILLRHYFYIIYLLLYELGRGGKRREGSRLPLPATEKILPRSTGRVVLLNARHEGLEHRPSLVNQCLQSVIVLLYFRHLGRDGTLSLRGLGFGRKLG